MPRPIFHSSGGLVVLTLSVVLAGLTATPAAGQSSAGSGPLNYPLTMANVKKMAKAFENIDAAIKADPSLKAKYAKDTDDDDSNAQTPDEIIARLEKDPTAKQAFPAAGISVRDGVQTEFALFQAAAGAYMLQQGSKPPADWSAANIKFYQQNAAELEQIGAKLRKMESFNDVDQESEDQAEPGESDNEQ